MGTIMLAAATMVPNSTAGGVVTDTASSVDQNAGQVLRYAKLDDVGIVYRVIITIGTEGYVLMSQGTGPGLATVKREPGGRCYNLHTWSTVKPEHVRINNGRSTDVVTVRITTVALREPQVGDDQASRLQKQKTKKKTDA